MFNREVYLAILLQEEGLYHRCRIYATDMNETVLRKASVHAGTAALRAFSKHKQAYDVDFVPRKNIVFSCIASTAFSPVLRCRLGLNVR